MLFLHRIALKLVSFLTLLFCLSLALYGQKEANHWVFGNGGHLDFAAGYPVSVGGAGIASFEACASISDAQGNLLFYSDGLEVWDAAHNIMPNGAGLKGDKSITQSVIILQDPSSSVKYHLFTLNDSLHYSIIDMSLNGGMGDLSLKNVFVIDDLTQKMTATPNCANDGYWLAVHANSDQFVVFELTSTGLSTPSYQAAGSSLSSSIGQMKFSPNSKRIAYSDFSFNLIEVFDFDNTTGLISSPITMQASSFNKPYGLEFSPNSQVLYASSIDVSTGTGPTYVMQFDLSSGVQATIFASRVDIAVANDKYVYGSLQLGPDKRMYVSKNNTNFISVVDQPDVLGVGCVYLDNIVDVSPSLARLGLPNIIGSISNSRFDITSDTSICPGEQVQLELIDNNPYLSVVCGPSVSTCSGSPVSNKVGQSTFNNQIVSPFNGMNRNARFQYLYTAAEMQVSGMTTAGIISSLSFDIAVQMSIAPYENFTISIGCTNTSDMISWETGLTQVYQGSHTATMAQNNFPFTTNYDWDGTSNLVVEVCYFISSGSSLPVSSDEVTATATPFMSTLGEFSNVTLSSCINGATPMLVVPERPDAFFEFCSTAGNVISTYSWSPNVALTNSSITNPIANPIDTTLYTITIDDGNCVFEKSVKINVRNNPVPQLGVDTTICLGDSLPLYPGNYSIYAWSDGSSQDTLWVSSTGTYGVTVTDSTGCSGEDSVYVHVLFGDLGQQDTSLCYGDSIILGVTDDSSSIFSWSTGDTVSSISYTALQKDTIYFEISDSNLICYDTVAIDVYLAESILSDTLALCSQDSVMLSAPDSLASYAWSTGDTLDSTWVSSSGMYYLSVTDSAGCSRQDSTLVNFLRDSIQQTDTSICFGDSLILNLAMGSNYMWSTGDTTDTIKVGPTSNTTYYVSISDSISNCVDSVNVVVGPAQSMLPDTLIVCGEDSVLLDPVTAYIDYNWIDGDSQALKWVDTTGIYWVDLLGADSCLRRDSIYVHFLNDTLIQNDTLICNYQSVNLSVSGAQPLSYAWSTSETTQSISVSPTTTSAFYVTISDTIASCIDSLTIQVAPVVMNLDDSIIICNSDSVEIGTDSTYAQYLWDFGDTVGKIWVDSSATYSLIVTDSLGCSREDSTYVSLVIADLGPDTILTCYQTQQLLTNPLQSHVSYSWSTGGNTNNEQISSDSSMFVYITVTDNNVICVDSVFLFVQPADIQLADTFSTCGWDSVELVSAPFAAYSWSNGSTDSSTWVDSSGKYYLTITDSNACQREDSTIAILNPILPVTLIDDTTICDNAGVMLDAGLYSQYLWSDSSILQTLSVSVSGMYHVTVTDSNSCPSSDSVLISLKSSVGLNMPGDTSVCPGDSVFIDIPGFANYLWSDSTTDSTLFLTAGNYQLTVSDSVGCTNVDSINVTEWSIVINDLGPNQTICSNQAFTLTAGPANGTYLWQDSSVFNTMLVSDSGLYSVEVTDSNGCSSQDSLLISYFNSPVLDIGSDTAICPNSSYTISLSGFNFYLWQNGTTLPVYTVLDSGVYHVEAYDAFGCMWTDTVEVKIDTSLNVSLRSDTSVCFGDTIILDAQNIGFSFIWQDSSTQQTYVVTDEGDYLVEVTDTFGCVRSDSVFIGVLDPTISPDDNTICLGDSVELTVSDIPLSSVSLEDFSLTTNSSNLHISVPTQSGKTYILKASGVYSTTSGEMRDVAYIYEQSGVPVTPIQGLGFLWNGAISLPSWAAAIPVYNTNHEYEFVFTGNGLVQLFQFADLDYTDNFGSLEFSLYEIGGSILWSNSDTTYNTTAKPIFNMQYSVILDNGLNVCYDTVKIAVSNLTSSVDSVKDVQCYGQSNGEAHIAHFSGYGPYDVNWVNALNDTIKSTVNVAAIDSYKSLLIGAYDVHIVDSIGCVDSLSFTINQPSLLQAQIMDTTMVLCKSDSNGAITMTPFGGIPGYTYNWAPINSTDSIIDSLPAGIYTITITDANLCDTVIGVAITEPDTLELSYVKFDNYCDQTNGQLDLGTLGGTSPYSYSTTGGNIQQTAGSQLTGLMNGTYTITITDANNCIYVDSVVVDSVVAPVVNIIDSMGAFCRDSLIYLSGDASINNPNITSWKWWVGIETFFPYDSILLSGQDINYFFPATGSKMIYLYVKDQYGCKDTDTVSVDIFDIPSPGFYADTTWGCDSLCVQFYDSSTTIDTSTYFWDLGNGVTLSDTSDPYACFNQTGIYDIALTITNPYGCSASILADDYIKVYQSPTADFSFDPGSSTNLGPPVSFTDLSTDAIIWFWDFGDSTYSSEQNPIHLYGDTGNVVIMLAVQSDKTCEDTIYKTLYLETYHSIFIPNVFTPNNDKVNDVFIPVGKFQGIIDYRMDIYNRWGDLIFTTSDKYTGWNGGLNNDITKIVHNGAYVYYIELTDNQGETTSYKGHFVLLVDY